MNMNMAHNKAARDTGRLQQVISPMTQNSGNVAVPCEAAAAGATCDFKLQGKTPSSEWLLSLEGLKK